jgi:hypothetical protein
MNWKLMVQLSLFGLAMGLGTVALIPSSFEPACWAVIFAVSAYLIASLTAGRRFLHGVLVGLANSVWVTASHVAFFATYFANHPQEAEMMKSMPSPEMPRLMMAITGPVIGLISGVVIGLLAAGVARTMKRRTGDRLSA